MNLPTLIGLPYSPWSERARWALELRNIAYRSVRYQPILGELSLRRTTGRWRGPVSVPVLVADDTVLDDSFDIARWADRHGEGPRLFPEGREQDVAHWNALSERGLGAGRALGLRRMLGDREALLEMVPKAMRAWGGLAEGIARLGVARTLRKYGATVSARSELEEALDTLAAATEGSTVAEPRTLLGAFSYADITAAQILVFVDPPRTGLRIGTASRRSFTDPQLQARYAGLLAWRDAIYARWRGASVA